jgi:integrase
MSPRGPAESRAELAADPDLRSWYDNTANGSRITADVYLRRLLAFCREMGVDRRAIAERRSRETELRDLLVRFVNAEAKKGRSGEYTRSTVKAVRSWLLHHNRRVTLPVKIPGAGRRPTLETEEIPTPEQLRAVLLGATANERLCCALMAFSGLRPEVLGNYEGTDGLRVSDLVGVEVVGGSVRFPEPPLRIRVRAASSKAGHSYFTWLGAEGVEYLRTVLEERARKGEEIGPDTDVVHPYRAKKKFVRALNVGDQVRLALRRAGIPARPYVLRSYFASRLLEAQNAGKVARDYSEFWMGHTGDVTQRHYTTGRARLPDSLVASMREAYRRCEPFLSTTPTAARGPSNAEAFRVLLSAWYTDEEIGKVDLDDTAAVVDALRRGAAKGAVGPRQRVIDEAELPKYLADGWTAKMPVNGARFVVERTV